jgi:hypothetical protein
MRPLTSAYLQRLADLLRFKFQQERERRRIGLGTFYVHFRWYWNIRRWGTGFQPCFGWRLPFGKDHTWKVGPMRNNIKGQHHVLLESWLGWR